MNLQRRTPAGYVAKVLDEYDLIDINTIICYNIQSVMNTRYERYFSATVGNYLVAPTAPNTGALVLDELRTPEDIKTRSRVVYLDETTGMAIVDKQFAHAVEEVMWLHAEVDPIATFSDYVASPDGAMRAARLLQQIGRCAAYAEQAGNCVAASWSSDPLTDHRPSIQGEKRLHFHLTSRSPEDMLGMDNILTDVASLPEIDRHRLAERYAFVASTYFTDVLHTHGVQTHEIHPNFLSVHLGSEWTALGDPSTSQRISLVLDIIHNAYDSVLAAIGGEQNNGIPFFNNLPDIPTLGALTDVDSSSVGLALLHDYLTSVKQTIGRESRCSLDDKHYSIVEMPSRGFAYSANISRYNDELYLNIRPCKLSDYGGAGCAIIDGIPVRIKKGGPAMNDDQIARRRFFVETVHKEVSLTDDDT